uniref:Uncharacterized protein n=1 Tax=Anopheles atroparvus TaxID=41427 RepID=A0AAG5D1Z5_ANOAO
SVVVCCSVFVNLQACPPPFPPHIDNACILLLQPLRDVKGSRCGRGEQKGLNQSNATL